MNEPILLQNSSDCTFHRLTGTIVLAAFSGLITIIGLILNTLTIYILLRGYKVTRDGKKKQIHKAYLASADLLGAVVLPALTYFEATNSMASASGWVHCVIIDVVTEFVQYSSILHQLTTAITVYINIIYPLKYLIYSTTSKRRVGAAVWCSTILFSFDPNVIGILIRQNSTGYRVMSCANILSTLPHRLRLAHKIYYPLKYVIPTVVFALLLVITEVRAKRGRRYLEKHAQVHGKSRKLWMLTVLKTDGVVTTISWSCWALYHAVLADLIPPESNTKCVADFVMRMLILVNTVTTPLFYLCIWTSFRADARVIWRALTKLCSNKLCTCNIHSKKHRRHGQFAGQASQKSSAIPAIEEQQRIPLTNINTEL